LDSRFRDYEPILFSTQSKSLDRTLQTAEDNAKLDASINEFLRLLSPHFLLKPATKALEWLIWRFYIHEYNVDALVGCALPYHETAHFIRVCKLLQSGNCGQWEFLVKVGKSSLPLDRSSLIHQCRKQPAIVDFIMHLVCYLCLVLMKLLLR
jgi:hypothetical protein